MKNVYIIISFMLLAICSFGQKKPTEKPPTQKEMQDMIKEMQQGMDEISEEDKKMMDSMGIKMPNMKALQKTIAGVSDKQLKQAWEEANRIVPVKDATRISSISKAPLTSATIEKYLSTTHEKIMSRLSPEVRSKGEEIYKYLKAEYPSNTPVGNTAAGLWLMGKPALALYLMGQACIENSEDPNMLNNYAAMLTMCGAEELAIPVLNNLNNQFPKNSTILNNIGQAWFGLGEMAKAETYLDSTIRIYGYHSQANLSKGAIEESKGNSKGAIEAVKRSVKGGYSMEKANKLEKLGYKLTPDDIPWNVSMPQDALGLDKFTWPQRPIKVDFSAKLEEKWDKFNEICSKEISVLKLKASQLETEMGSITEDRMNSIMAASKQGGYISPYPKLAFKAMAKLSYLVQDKDGSDYFSYKTNNEALLNSLKQIEELETKLEYDEAKINEEFKDLFGEGKSNPYEAHCAAQNAVRNNFLASANALLDESYNSYLKHLKRKINDYVYYYQYTQWPEVFEVIKINAKIQWLSVISGQRVYFKNIGGSCDQVKVKDATGSPKLQEFDDVHCMYHSELSTPVGTIRTDCSRITSTLDLKFVKLGLKQDMNKNTFSEQFMNCTVEVGAGVAFGEKNLGPIKAEAAVGGSIAVEIDRSGITDVILKGAAGVSVGTNVINDGSEAAGVNVGVQTKDGSASDVGAIKDLQLEAGFKGQISLISGKSSVGLTGILEKK